MNGNNVMVIFSKGIPTFNSNAKASDLVVNPVGKGKGLNKKSTPSIRNRASAKSGPEVVNPCFLVMADLCSDPFWRTTFNDAAIGKFHRGFKFIKDTLYFKVRNKIQECKITNLEPELAIEVIKNFMCTTAGIMSSCDIDRHNNQLKDMIVSYNENQLDSWSKIRSTQQRAILIANYVATVTEALNLTEHEADKLYDIINIGIIMKCFDNNNITVANNTITNITGLYRRENGEFVIDMSLASDKKSGRCVSYNDDTNTDVYGQYENVEQSHTTRINILKEWSGFLNDVLK